MKNKFKFIGIVVFVILIGISMVACNKECPDSPNGKHGNWTEANYGTSEVCGYCWKVYK